MMTPPRLSVLAVRNVVTRPRVMVETVQRGQVGERCGGRMMGLPNEWDMVMHPGFPQGSDIC